MKYESKGMLLFAESALFLGAVTLALGSSAAQTVTSQLGSPSGTTTIDGKQLPAPPPKFGGVINESAKNSTPWWPPRVVPPKGAPNVLLIMTDDQGYGVRAPSAVSSHPALERVAQVWLCGTPNFTPPPFARQPAPRSSPAAITTRSASASSVKCPPASRVTIPCIGQDSATVGEILKENGYATSWFGKNHNTPSYQYSDAGPYDQWPSGMGFDYFYGFMGGETDQWTPISFAITPRSFLGRKARLQPHHRPRGRCDQAHARSQRGRTQQAVLRVLRARWHPLPTPAHTGMDRQI